VRIVYSGDHIERAAKFIRRKNTAKISHFSLLTPACAFRSILPALIQVVQGARSDMTRQNMQHQFKVKSNRNAAPRKKVLLTSSLANAVRNAG